jgi:hypothetical protein
MEILPIISRKSLWVRRKRLSNFGSIPVKTTLIHLSNIIQETSRASNRAWEIAQTHLLPHRIRIKTSFYIRPILPEQIEIGFSKRFQLRLVFRFENGLTGSIEPSRPTSCERVLTAIPRRSQTLRRSVAGPTGRFLGVFD